MEKVKNDRRAVSVPHGQLTRFGHMGVMAGAIAGNMVMHGLAQLGKGQRPSLPDLMLTPHNINRVTNQLAKLRGAAMKIGQLISMDTGDFFSPDLALIMARLREDADSMPPNQLKKVLNTEWPKNWLNAFESFDVHPIAAASIGQVHRAQLKDGRCLAIKVQYPGIKDSIDNDIENVGILIKMSRILPKNFALASYLEEASNQLHLETDYEIEAGNLRRFGNLLNDTPEFIVPKVHADWSTPSILAMDYLEGSSIEDSATMPQSERDKIALRLIKLNLRELFTFGVMQTDPNFANYKYQVDTQKIVLLDFGATRDIAPHVADQYRQLINAGLSNDNVDLLKIAQEIGFFDATTRGEHCKIILQMMQLIFEVLRRKGKINFKNHEIAKQLQVEGFALIKDQFIPPPLPIDILLLQRKFAGMFLLCAKLGASVDVFGLLSLHLERQIK